MHALYSYNRMKWRSFQSNIEKNKNLCFVKKKSNNEHENKHGESYLELFTQ